MSAEHDERLWHGALTDPVQHGLEEHPRFGEPKRVDAPAARTTTASSETALA